MRAAVLSLCAATAAALVSACSVLPTPDPVQLYRFGDVAPAAPAPRVAEPVVVALRPVRFSAASRGDRILGITGAEAAYIGGARWLSPAETLFADSLEANFAARSGAVRLAGRRESAPAALSLDVEVLGFEARYAAPGAAPVVAVTARVRLMGQDRALRAEQTFAVERPASANRVSAIVDAFDAATGEVQARIVAWTEAEARGR